MEYTPSGIPIIYAVMAARQSFLGRDDYGYFDLVAEGEFAREIVALKIGKKVRLIGQLWNRKFRDREQRAITQTRIVVTQIKLMEEK